MNWTETAANWNRDCVVDTAERPVVDPGHAFAVLRDACEPFSRGLRFFSIPAVVFEADGDQQSAPGDWLPAAADTDLPAYLSRLSTRAGNWRLRVVEPLFTDYRLWSRVRERLTPLWSIVGTPVLPVASELIIAAGDVELCAAEPAHLNLVFVLSGRATLHDGDTTRQLSQAQVVQLPATGTTALRATDGCLALRLRVPTDRRLPVTDAVRLISQVVAAEAAGLDEPVPELSFPPAVDGDRFQPPVRPEAPQRPPHRDDYRLEAEHLLRTWWAGRASAAGLDPVPDPGEPPPLRPDERVRLGVPVLVLPADEPDQQLWAVNGMAFTVAGPIPAAVLERLRDGTCTEVADLCRDADGRDNGAEVLLDRLHALRALEIVKETS